MLDHAVTKRRGSHGRLDGRLLSLLRVGLVTTIVVASSRIAAAAPPRLPPAAPAAESNPSPTSLSWLAPSECPTRNEVWRRVTDSMPSHNLSVDPTTSLDLSITRSSSQYRAVVQLSSVRGNTRREFIANDCETATHAIALMVAIFLDPVAIGERWVEAVAATEQGDVIPPPAVVPSPPTTATPPPPNRPASSSTPAIRSTAAPPIREPLAFTPDDPTALASTAISRPAATRSPGYARLEAAGDVGSLPRPGLALSGGAGFGSQRLAVELGARYHPPQLSTNPAGEGGMFQLITAATDTCARWQPSVRWKLSACGGIDAGAILGRGYGLSPSRRAARARVAIGGEARVTRTADGGFGIYLAARLDGVVVRPRFTAENVGDVHVAAPWSGGAALGITIPVWRAEKP